MLGGTQFPAQGHLQAAASGKISWLITEAQDTEAKYKAHLNPLLPSQLLTICRLQHVAQLSEHQPLEETHSAFLTGRFCKVMWRHECMTSLQGGGGELATMTRFVTFGEHQPLKLKVLTNANDT